MNKTLESINMESNYLTGDVIAVGLNLYPTLVVQS